MDNDDPRLLEQRIGYITDGREHDPRLPAVLTYDAEQGIVVTLPLRDDEDSWGLTGYNYTEPPSTLVFQDTLGIATLYGCSWRGATRQLTTSAATVRLSADYLANGYPVTYQDSAIAHQIRSRISGLHKFLGWSSQSEIPEFDENRRYKALNIRLEAPESITIRLKDLVATMDAAWRQDNRTGQMVTDDETWFRTESVALEPWARHLETHAVMRDLVALATWTPSGFERHEFLREDNPERTLSGAEIGPKWQRVLTNRTRNHRELDATKTKPRPTFDYKVVGIEGLRRWFEIRETHSRSIGPLLSTLTFGLPAETQLLQVGIALEAFGFTAAQTNGKSEEQADRIKIRKHVADASRTAPIDFSVLVGNLDKWSETFALAYNAVKHASQALPDGAKCFHLARAGSWLLRLHFMSLIGVPEEVLASRASENDWTHLASSLKPYL